MATNPLRILQDRLYSEADAALSQRINDRLAAVRNNLPRNARVRIPAGEYTLDQLVDRIELEAFKDRRDQNRASYVDAFLNKVRRFEGQ